LEWADNPSLVQCQTSQFRSQNFQQFPSTSSRFAYTQVQLETNFAIGQLSMCHSWPDVSVFQQFSMIPKFTTTSTNWEGSDFLLSTAAKLKTLVRITMSSTHDLFRH
jgi:hypothetical protein